MGLLQKAVETYEMVEKGGEAEIKKGKQPLALLFQTPKAVKAGDLEITLNKSGCCIRMKQIKDKEKRLIPATKESLNRTSGSVAHPLCDQLKYLCNNAASKNEENFNAYVNQLEEWANSEFSHPMLKPILTYVKSNEILKDLHRHG